MNNCRTLPALHCRPEPAPVRGLADDVDSARQQRLAELKAALQAGTYRPSIARIASRLWASGDLATG